MPKKEEVVAIDANQLAMVQLKWSRIEAVLTFLVVTICTITIGIVIVLVFRLLYPSAMNGADAVTLFYLFISILLPIVPAYVFFKFLPKSDATVTGPFSGLKIKLGGAFAGYFLLLLFVTVSPRPKVDEVWTVKGMISNEPAAPIAKSDELIVSIEPPLVAMQSDYSFQTKVPVSWHGGKRVFPTLVIGRLPEAAFGKVIIHLGGDFIFGPPVSKEYKTLVYHVDKDEAEHELNVKEQIEVPKIPGSGQGATPLPYIGQGAAPTPTIVPTPQLVPNKS